MAEAERPDEVVVKSGATATGLAIGGTVAGFALMAAGGNAESEELGWLGLGVAVVGPARKAISTPASTTIRISTGKTAMR